MSPGLTLLFAALALCLSPPPAFAQDLAAQPPPAAGAGAVALIVVLPLDGPPEEGLRKVLASVMRLELERGGLQTLLFASTDEQALVRDLREGQAPGLRGLLQGLAALSPPGNRDFLVLGGYTRVGEEIQVEFGITDAQRGEIVGQASVRAAVDFSLDEVMIRALRRLLAPAQDRIAEVARLRADQAALAQVAPPQEAPAERVEEGSSVSEGAGGAPVLEANGGQRSRFRRLEFSVGFAPFIPLGAAGDALEVGFVPFAYLDYRIPTVAGILGVGLFSGLSLFSAGTSELASYFRYVVPVGVDVRFSGPEALRLGMFVRGGLGAGVNVSSFEKLPPGLRDDLSRVLPYLYAGIGARIAFSEGVGLALDVLYQSYAHFYRETPGGKLNAEWIMGVVPSLYIFTRL